MMAKRIVVAVAVWAVLSMAGLANAGFLGHAIRVRSEWDSGVRDTRFINVVDPGTEITDFPSELGWDIDITDTSIRFDKLEPAYYDGVYTQFNGTRFYDYTETIPSILDVQIVSTDINGMSLSRIMFDENNISVNYAGLGLDGQESLYLDVTFVPEPASVLLLALGGISIVRRRVR